MLFDSIYQKNLPFNGNKISVEKIKIQLMEDFLSNWFLYMFTIYIFYNLAFYIAILKDLGDF